jgi:hypothetical protein
VEEVFVRVGRVFHLHVGGRLIRTTAEHPFYARGRGWVAAGELRVGDELASHDGQWVAVEDRRDTGEVETVYNLRVADYHTYFVGCDEWGFSVWAHNTYIDPQTGQPAAPRRNSQITREVEEQLLGMGFSRTEARQLARAGAAEGMNGQGLRNAINSGDLAVQQIATGGRGGFSYGIQRLLPEFDGVTTHAILITNEGRVMPFRSGNASTEYRYSSIGHTEAEAAIWIRQNGSSGGTIYQAVTVMLAAVRPCASRTTWNAKRFRRDSGRLCIAGGQIDDHGHLPQQHKRDLQLLPCSH